MSDDMHARTHTSGGGAPTPEHAHHVDHAGHEAMFRRRFLICLPLSLPVLFFSPSMQGWLNYTAPSFPGSEWVTPLFAGIVFLYGGVPFLTEWPKEWSSEAPAPGMMTLIALAISVA